jgi:hypothetical protein
MHSRKIINISVLWHYEAETECHKRQYQRLPMDNINN